MSDFCSAQRSAALAAKEVLLNYRLLIVLVCLFLINVFLDQVHTKVLPRLKAYQYLSPESCQDLSMRILQLILGPIIFIGGIVSLLYQASTGCNISEIYVYWIAGTIFVSVDLHEFVRRWPLRPTLLAHHVMSFVIAIAFLEFNILPPNKEKIISWATILFFTNLGLMWMVDFYHVVFRTSQNLKLIMNYRIVYLWLAPVRLTNIVLSALGAINCAIGGVWFGLVCLLLATAAYSYNSYTAIMFVFRFDCETYYTSHQEKWFAEELINIDEK